MKSPAVETPYVGPYQDHLRYQNREPRTLEELLLARADYEAKKRRTEIKALSGKLKQLDPFMAPVLAAGVRLSYRDIGTWDGGKTLRIQAPISGKERDAKLLQILLGLGFKEISRRTYGTLHPEDDVTLKHGRSLVLTVVVAKPEGGEA